MRLVALPSALLVALALSGCRNASSAQADVALARPGPVESSPPIRDARVVDLPAGTTVAVRLDRALSTDRNRAGDAFDAMLDEPVAVNGIVVLPKGTRFSGHVTRAEASERLRGRGVLGITLDAFVSHGERYTISTSLDSRRTDAHKKRNIELIGGGAGIGALIGGLAGGGKGAGIGAAVGAAAGTGGAAATGRKNVEVPAETLFRFSLEQSVQVKAPTAAKG